MLVDKPPTHLDDESPRSPWLVFSVLAATAALTILDVSKVGVALPSIQASMGGSESAVQFMLVGYTIAYALFLLPSGRLGDLLSRKAVFLVGSTTFVAASILCAVAPTAHTLVLGRLIQGVGAGILMPQVLGMMQRLFPAMQRAKPLAILAAVIATTSTFGPVLAGTVMELAGTGESWRVLFWINVGVGAVILPLAWRLIGEPRPERRRGFDAVGALLLVPAVVLTIFPLSTISSTNGPAWWMLACGLLGLVFSGLFVHHEVRVRRNGAEPLVDPGLFHFGHFPSGVLISGLMHAAGTASALIITLFLQQVAGQTPLETALWMLPAASAMIAGSWLAGRLPQGRSRGLIVTGTAIGATAQLLIAAAISTIGVDAIPLALCLLLILSAFGTSLVGAPNQARALVEIPAFRSSVAGSLLQFAQRVGSAFGMALAMIVYYIFLFQPVAWSGERTLGPTLAVALTGCFTLAALVVGLTDRAIPRPR